MNNKKDIFFIEAVDLIRKSGVISFQKIMRHFRVGYARAIRLLNELENMGVLGPDNGDSKPREILIKHEDDGSVWKNPSER